MILKIQAIMTRENDKKSKLPVEVMIQHLISGPKKTLAQILGIGT